jgi:REP element-mobilizing transposase RayT
MLTNQIFVYCLAMAAEKCGVVIHAVCVLSNHYHAVITDPEGRLPEFCHWLNLYVAKCINASYGRWENLWASEPPSAVLLKDDEDVLDKIAYCLANPVLAELVARGDMWTGLRSRPTDVGGDTATQVDRPGVFFRPNGPMPQKATLRFSRPDIYPRLDRQQLIALVQRAVDEREGNKRTEMERAGRRFAGMRRVLSQRPGNRPMTREPRRGLKPRFAAKNKWLRIEAARRLKSFLVAYREAYDKFKQGVRDVVFPFGTYALRRRHGVLVPKLDTA